MALPFTDPHIFYRAWKNIASLAEDEDIREWCSYARSCAYELIVGTVGVYGSAVQHAKLNMAQSLSRFSSIPTPHIPSSTRAVATKTLTEIQLAHPRKDLEMGSRHDSSAAPAAARVAIPAAATAGHGDT